MLNVKRVLLVSLIFISVQSLAKDLTNRLGVGFSDQFATSSNNSLPSIAVKYYPNPDFAYSVALGVDTQENASRFGFAAKMYRTIFVEENMNFYMGGGAALLSEELTVGIVTENSSGFELSGFAGGEFFLTGLESVGFSFEVGVGIVSVSNQVRFRTIGDSPFKAGIIFYF